MSVPFLSAEWIAALPDHAGGSADADSAYSAVIGFEISDAPSGKLRAHVVLTEGAVVSAEGVKSKEAQCTIGLSAEVAQEILLGELDWKAAYMRGDLKLSDDYEQILYRSGELTATTEWSAFVEKLVAATTF